LLISLVRPCACGRICSLSRPGIFLFWSFRFSNSTHSSRFGVRDVHDCLQHFSGAGTPLLLLLPSADGFRRRSVRFPLFAPASSNVLYRVLRPFFPPPPWGFAVWSCPARSMAANLFFSGYVLPSYPRHSGWVIGFPFSFFVLQFQCHLASGGVAPHNAGHHLGFSLSFNFEPSFAYLGPSCAFLPTYCGPHKPTSASDSFTPFFLFVFFEG